MCTDRLQAAGKDKRLPFCIFQVNITYLWAAVSLFSPKLHLSGNSLLSLILAATTSALIVLLFRVKFNVCYFQQLDNQLTIFYSKKKMTQAQEVFFYLCSWPTLYFDLGTCLIIIIDTCPILGIDACLFPKTFEISNCVKKKTIPLPQLLHLHPSIIFKDSFVFPSKLPK